MKTDVVGALLAAPVPAALLAAPVPAALLAAPAAAVAAASGRRSLAGKTGAQRAPLQQSFPRRRESRLKRSSQWIPACAGMTILLAIVFCFGSVTAFGQVATGFPPFGSFSGGSFDTVNNANLNVHLQTPVVSKAGRGMSFSYAITFDNSLWSLSYVNSQQAWTPAAGWGWAGSVQPATGSLNYNEVLESCYWPENQYGQTYYFDEFYVNGYTDPSGTSHPFSVQVSGYSYTPCQGYPFPPSTASGTATDGSGFTLQADAGSGQGALLYASVTSVSGTTVVPPLPQYTTSVTDSNGNQVTASTSGDSTTFTDTLGMTALTVSGSGTPSSPVNYVYANPPPGGSSQVTLNYSTYTVQTNFGCSGISEFGPTAENLVSSIALPDGSSYAFTYEETPGYSGSVTGRIASIKLPTGGTISYSYSGGANDGINCSDGSGNYIERTTPDGVWTYKETGSAPATTTTVTDPAGNETIYQFQGIYETERKIYQGSSTVLETVDTCYNGATSPCTGTAITLPITQRSVMVTLAGVSSPAETVTDYNTYGLPTETDVHDYGPALIRKTLITYASPGNNIQDRPASVTVENASSTPVAESSYAYDSKGNLLTLSENVTSSSTISRSFTYGTGGVLATATDFKGNSTNFTYGDCSSSFPTSIAQPLSLTSSLTWDCNTGLVTSVTDPNSQTTSFSYDDMLRLIQTNNPDGGQVSTAYNDASNPMNLVTTTKLNASQNRTDTAVLDGLGRVSQTQLNSDPAGADYVNTTYDSLGRVESVTNPYRGSPSGSSSYAYDALGRVTSVTYADGSAATASYSGNCATSTDPAGKKRETCVNALGEVTKVIEDPGGLNYETDYAYDALGNLISVNDGGQTRSYIYDMLSRLISATTPESGTTNYSYNASGGALCSGDPSNVCTRTDARGITATYKYDAMNRLTWKNYSDSTPAVNFAYDRPNIWINNTLIPVSNGKGRVGVTCVEVGTSCVAMDGYSYNAMGRVIDHWQCSLGECTATPPYWHTHYDFDLAGDVKDWTHPAGFTITNNINTAQQVTQMSYSPSDSTHPSNFIPSITYTPWGAESTLEDGCVGSGCTTAVETYVYNNRMQPVMIELGNTSNAAADDCLVYNYYAGAANPTSCAAPAQSTDDNGSVMGFLYQDNVNASLGHTETYAYDALNRLSTAVATGNSTYNLAFTYDRWGNMGCTINSQTQGLCPQYSFSASTNHITNTGYTYDAAGNLTSDGTYTYQYDAEDRPQNVTEGGNPFASLTYNADGQMVSLLYQAYGNEQVVGVFSPAGRELGYYDGGSGDWYDREIWAAGRIVAQSFDASSRGGRTQYLHANALGSDSQITIQTGASGYDILFYPWGQYWTHAGSQAGDTRFAGLEQTTAMDSYDTPTRQYGKVLGRWLTPDLLGGDITNPQSLNRYAYVLNNPTTLTDPSGMGPQQTFCIPSYEGSYEPYIQTGNCGSTANSPAGPGPVTIDANGDPLSAELAEAEARYASNFGWLVQGNLYGHSYSQFFSSLDAYFNWRTSLAVLPENQCYQSAMVVANNQGLSSVSGTCTSGTLGLTYTFTLGGSKASVNLAAVAKAGGWLDPAGTLLEPANSWYLGGFLGAFFSTSHLIDSSPSGSFNMSAHIDPCGPLNPCHYIIQLPLGSFKGVPQPVSCSVNGGCTFQP